MLRIYPPIILFLAIFMINVSFNLTQTLTQGSWIFLLYTALLVGLTSTIRLILSIKNP